MKLATELDAQSSTTVEDWHERVNAIFPAYFTHAMSDPHTAIWEWGAAIERTSAPRPFVAIWPRGRGKSTHAEAIAVDLGARGKRHYCMYVSGTQDQADKHIQTVARMMESEGARGYGPHIGTPRVGKNGGRTWNRSIMTTANGFTVEAVGLNKAVRGQKIDWARPDLIIFDDIDEKHDTPNATRKKVEVITGSILPAGADNTAVLFVQNLIHAESVADSLSKPSGETGSAQYLMNRVISGPYPAVDGLQYEAQPDGERVRWVITQGDSLWEGYDLSVCERELNRVGPSAFLLESQHEVDADKDNALLSQADFERTRILPPNAPPALLKRAVGVDPPGGRGSCGIVAGGYGMIAGERHGYTIDDASTGPGASPEEWALEVLKCCARNNALLIIAEVNFGGDMVTETIRNTKWKDDTGRVLMDGARDVKIVQVRASRGKTLRAAPVAVLFQQGYAHHVGHFPALEKQWRTYEPDTGQDSPDRLDAEVWLYAGLGLTAEQYDPPKSSRYV